MTESSLQFQVLRYRPHVLWAEAVIVDAPFRIPLPDRIEPALNDHTSKINRAWRLVHEALLARSVYHEIRSASMIQALANLVHQIDRIANASGRHVAMGMPGCHHAGKIFGKQLLSFGDLGPRGREGRHASIRRARRCLDARVRVLLIVVADDQAVVISIERARYRGETNVRRTAVARLTDNIWKRALPLALPNHGFIGRGYARSKAPRAANLCVRPRHVIGSAQVRTVGDIHAPGRSDQDGIVACGLAGHPVLDRRPAAGTRPVARHKWLGRR